MRRISLGEYAIEYRNGSLRVLGPDAQACLTAEERLYPLLGTDEGARLLGRARLGPTIDGVAATRELAEHLGLHYEPGATAVETFVSPARTLDYDDDHRRIRALNLPRIVTRTITEFEGLCAGIVYDGIVDDTELEMILDWMEAKAEFLHAWPLCDVRDLMHEILADSVIDDDERRQLFALLDSIGDSADNCGKAADNIFDESPAIEFPKRSFLFTGRLAICKRKDAQAAVEARGGRAAKSVTRKLDYLVVGDLGTDAWQYSRYGPQDRSRHGEPPRRLPHPHPARGRLRRSPRAGRGTGMNAGGHTRVLLPQMPHRCGIWIPV